MVSTMPPELPLAKDRFILDRSVMLTNIGVNNVTYDVRYRIAAVPATKTHLTQRHFQASRCFCTG
jgi:hypothetical protein